MRIMSLVLAGLVLWMPLATHSPAAQVVASRPDDPAMRALSAWREATPLPECARVDSVTAQSAVPTAAS